VSKPDFANLVEQFVGSGRAIPVENHGRGFSETVEVAESTVRRWKNKNDKSEPDRLELRRIFRAPQFPMAFRKSVADTLFVGCDDLAVTLCDRRPVARCPVDLSFDFDAKFAAFQKKLRAAIHNDSPSRSRLSGEEQADIDPSLAELDAMWFEMRRAIDFRRLVPCNGG
jgi:hypothetical protein